VVFEEAVMAFGVEDDMVEEFDAEEVAGGFKALGDFNVFFARSQRAGGMVVGDDDGRCPISDGVCEDFAGVYLLQGLNFDIVVIRLDGLENLLCHRHDIVTFDAAPDENRDQFCI